MTTSLPRADVGGASSTTRTADPEGRARLPVPLGTTCLYAWLGEEAGGTTASGDGRSDVRVTIRLAPAIPLRGRVVQRDWRPIAGAAVVATVRGDLMGEGCPWSSRVTTREDGRFELPPVPAAALATEPFGLELSAAAPGFPDYGIQVTPDTPRPAEFVLVLMHPAKLRGRLVRPTGEPVHGEVVSVHPSDDSDDVLTGEDGRFEQTIARGGAVVSVFPPRRTWASRGSRDQSSAGWGCARTLGHVSGEEGDVDLGDVVLSAGARLAGTVVDEDGRPLARASVMLDLGNDQIGLTTSGPDGKFAFESVGDQPHRLTVSRRVAPEPSLDAREATVEGVRGGDVNVRVALTGAGTTVVRFVDSASRERVVSKHVKVQVRERGSDEPFGTWEWQGTEMDRWRFEPESPGTFDVVVEVDGYEPSEAVTVVVVADRETTVDVPLRKKHE